LVHDRGAAMVEADVAVLTTGVAIGFPSEAALCNASIADSVALIFSLGTPKSFCHCAKAATEAGRAGNGRTR
jgi:hypothetical protein